MNDSNTPGDKLDKCCWETGKSLNAETETDGDEEVLKFSIVVSNECTFVKVWAAIYLFSCFTSPYFYAWVALNGFEREERFYTSITIFFESVFAINIMLSFLTDFVPDGELVPERDLGKIADRYWHDGFMQEFIPTFPLTFLVDNSEHKFWRLIYLIKIIRLIKGIEIYDVQLMVDYLKEKNTQRVMKNIENDPTLL